MSPEDARNAALRSFGGVDLSKEECRDVRGVRLIEDVISDLRYGLRMLRRNPGFATMPGLTLALGIGANTAIFSVVDEVLLKRLPVKEPEQLILLSHTDAGTYSNSFSYSTYEQFRAMLRALGYRAVMKSRFTAWEEAICSRGDS